MRESWGWVVLLQAKKPVILKCGVRVRSGVYGKIPVPPVLRASRTNSIKKSEETCAIVENRARCLSWSPPDLQLALLKMRL